MAVLFPTDLQQQQPSDKIVLLAADKDNVAKNVRVGDLVQYIRDNVPLETLIETNRSQQATISLQQDNIDRLTDDVDSIRNDMQRINIPANTLEQELSVGKTDLASAITAKGVETAATDSLATMADNVREIVQETTTISGGEFYPNNMLGTAVWNLFDVAAMVKSRYISSGRYAGAIVAQYYKGYATLDLTSYSGGYAACLTSDGDFYANDGEHTAIGVHTWHDDDDGKADRYVVFLWLDDNYTFQSLSSGICPRQIVVVGTCASLQVNYNRLVQLYAPAEFGELKNFRLAGNNNPEGNWAAQQVWHNYKEHTTGTIFQNTNNLIYAEFTNLERVTGGIIFYAVNTNYNFNNLNAVSFPNLVTMSGGCLFNSSNSSYSFTALTSVSFPNLVMMSGGCLFSSNRYSFTALTSVSFPNLVTMSGGFGIGGATNAGFVDSNSIRRVSAPKLKTLNGIFISCRTNGHNNLTEVDFSSLETIGSNGCLFYAGYDTNSSNGFNALEELTMPSLVTCTGRLLFSSWGNGRLTSFKLLRSISLPKLEQSVTTFIDGSFPALEHIYIGYSTNDRTKSIVINNPDAPILTDVELKDGYCKNFSCTRTTLTAENIVNHILNRLGVNQAYLDEPTDANKLTITLGATNLAKLTDEEKQIAIDKGFTLA